MDILQSAKDYFDMEYNDAKRFVSRPTADPFWPRQYVDKTYARCLGVALFVQQLDVDYETINEIFEEFKEKINKLLDN